jgi:hypothetical protein
MMHVLPCEQVRDELTAYHDGELAIETQVLIHSHLQECVACRLEAAALVELSDALRTMAGSVPGRTAHDTGLITGAVLERIRVEKQLSFDSRVRERFQDMHLVWAGLGATAAVFFCVFVSAGVLHAASQERSDSLAGIISTIASGSTEPVRLVDTGGENDALLDTSAALPTGEDADLMLSAFVTRDGRIQNVALLEEQARVLRMKPEAVLAMIEAASRARFLPSQIGPFPGGVNVVWLVTSTTVKGLKDHDLYLLSPPRLAAPVAAFGPEPAKPVAAPKPIPSADNDALAAA